MSDLGCPTLMTENIMNQKSKNGCLTFLILFLEFEPVPEPSYGLTILKTDYKQRKKENDFFIKWQKIQDNLNASMKYASLTKLVLTLKGQDLW